MTSESQVQAGSCPGQDRTRTDLAARIEARIEVRMPNRISGLHVTWAGEPLILQGRARTYHVKQLAQEAALDLIGVEIPLHNQIEVG